MRRRLQYAMQGLDGAARRLVHPAERLRSCLQMLAHLRTRLAFAFGHRVHRAAARLERLEASLAGLDPSAVLRRGYSITWNADGAVLRDASQATPDEKITTRLARGTIESVVKKTDLL
jgi:exodeoxyribonuclease VII large subunit